MPSLAKVLFGVSLTVGLFAAPMAQATPFAKSPKSASASMGGAKLTGQGAGNGRIAALPRSGSEAPGKYVMTIRDRAGKQIGSTIEVAVAEPGVAGSAGKPGSTAAHGDLATHSLEVPILVGSKFVVPGWPASSSGAIGYRSEQLRGPRGFTLRPTKAAD